MWTDEETTALLNIMNGSDKLPSSDDMRALQTFVPSLKSRSLIEIRSKAQNILYKRKKQKTLR